MWELTYFRPSYRASGGELADAHRVVRTAAAVGQVLALPDAVLDPTLDAIERVENASDDPRVLEPAEVAALAEMAAMTERALADAIDIDQRPRGEGGERILREAALPVELGHGVPDRDRVFEPGTDGRVGLRYPRMSLISLIMELPALALFLSEAAQRGDAIELIAM